MILCITEKPKVGQDIARLLGATKPCTGYFEGNGYWVTWTYGHLCELKDPADYFPQWKPWTFSQLPMIPSRFGIRVKHDRGIETQFRTIEKLIGQCDEIINCGDAGQEGELIQRWVMQKAGCAKPVKRLWISSLTDESILEGFRHLRDQKDLEPLYRAGLCRAIGDWLLGINATRLYTLKYGSNRQVLSVGRVQTPTLALIVNRQAEIENFVPKDSWQLSTRYRDVVFTSSLKAYDAEEKGVETVERLRTHPFTVTDISKKKGKEAPPRLFDLTSLQVECNKKFGLSAAQTLNCIQSLYEKKITTYPRVDTTFLTDDIYPKCQGILLSLKPYSRQTAPLTGKKLPKSKKVFDNSKVTDHHAIIPTGEPIPSNLSIDEKRVFHTIALRFISVFYPDCTYEQTTVSGESDGIKFKAGGRVILDPGWKVLYSKGTKDSGDASDEEEESKVLPVFTTGESGPHYPFLAKKTTQPPKYYTQGTLLRAMETAGSSVEEEELRDALKANGIGRPSTRSSIIDLLFKRGYIRQERKSLRATEAGIELISLIKEELLKSAKLTGIWEGRLRQIERGTYDAAEFIAQLKQMITEITESVMRDPTNRRIKAQTTEGEEENKKGGKAGKGKKKSKEEKK